MAEPVAIEILVSTPEQLFNSLDPFPFRERDLDREAEEFIVSWARELPAAQPIRIVLHLPREQAANWSAAEIEAAFRRYFAFRAEAVGRELSELFRIGRRSLQIGVAVLLLSVAVSESLQAAFGREGVVRVLNEGFLIFGWVANWRPLEIFLYDWWPVAGRRRLYRQLAQCNVAFACTDH